MEFSAKKKSNRLVRKQEFDLVIKSDDGGRPWKVVKVQLEKKGMPSSCPISIIVIIPPTFSPLF